MTTRAQSLLDALKATVGDRTRSLVLALGEVTLEVDAGNFLDVAFMLRDAPRLRFEQCLDVAGVDYSTYGGGTWEGRRFAVVLQLLSVTHNWRLRLRTFCPDDDLPRVDSTLGVWSSVGWYEREAFDLYGIIFEGHPDLRRILTDYGFVGHPFRKDFPVSGHVEVRYDPEQRRVIYQPVTIEPREVTPRVIREEGYGQGR